MGDQMKSKIRLPISILIILGLSLSLNHCASTEERSEETANFSTTSLRTADPASRGLSESDFPRIKELSKDVYSYEQLRGAGVGSFREYFTTVSVFVVTEEGVLVADGQGSPQETKRMVDEIARLTDQPITHVVICSDHGDHTNGNSEFPDDALFISSSLSKARLELAAKNPDTRSGQDSSQTIVPTKTVDDEMTLNLGNKEIQILFLGRAHTGGDLHLFLPEENILFMSEAFLNGVFPAMRSAFPSEWVEVVDEALKMDVQTYVPGHGFVEEPAISREQLIQYKQALETVISEGTRLHEAGLTVDEAITQADWGNLSDWSLHDLQGSTAVRKIYQELNGELPSGEPRIITN